jgi:hypothetical protein
MIPMDMSFAKAEASRILRMCPSMWQDKFNLHPWRCVCFSCLSRLLSKYVPKKSSTHNPTRKNLTRGTRETRDLVLKLPSESARKLVMRNIVTCVRSIGAHTPRTIPRIVVGMRKMQRRNPTSGQQKKVPRNPVP